MSKVFNDCAESEMMRRGSGGVTADRGSMFDNRGNGATLLCLSSVRDPADGREGRFPMEEDEPGEGDHHGFERIEA